MHRPIRFVIGSTKYTHPVWGALLLLTFLMVCPSLAADDPGLTDAQQAAKQLAATLEAENSYAPVSRSRAPLVNLTAPSGGLGQRLVRVLYTSERVEVRVVRGRHTLVSPVDDVAAISTDARRPNLPQPDDGAMAVEVLID